MKDSQATINSEAIDVMVQGGREICERALMKWRQGDYLTGEIQTDNIERWKRIKSAIRDMRDRLKKDKR